MDHTLLNSSSRNHNPFHRWSLNNLLCHHSAVICYNSKKQSDRTVQKNICLKKKTKKTFILLLDLRIEDKNNYLFIQIYRADKEFQYKCNGIRGHITLHSKFELFFCTLYETIWFMWTKGTWFTYQNQNGLSLTVFVGEALLMHIQLVRQRKIVFLICMKASPSRKRVHSFYKYFHETKFNVQWCKKDTFRTGSCDIYFFCSEGNILL